MNDWILNYFYPHPYCIGYEFSELIAFWSYICMHILIFFTQSKHPRFTGNNLEKNKILYHRIENLAAKHGCTPAQLALAWLLHQGDDMVPIPGKSLSLFSMIRSWYLMPMFFIPNSSPAMCQATFSKSNYPTDFTMLTWIYSLFGCTCTLNMKNWSFFSLMFCNCITPKFGSCWMAWTWS